MNKPSNPYFEYAVNMAAQQMMRAQDQQAAARIGQVTYGLRTPTPEPAPPAVEERKWKEGEEVVLHAVVRGVEQADGMPGRIRIEGGAGLGKWVLYPFTSELRPKASQPAPVGDWVSGKEHAVVKGELAKLREDVRQMVRAELLPDQRGLESRLADASMERDRLAARLGDREVECGRLEREANRLKLELKAARAIIQRRGRL